MSALVFSMKYLHCDSNSYIYKHHSLRILRVIVLPFLWQTGVYTIAGWQHCSILPTHDHDDINQPQAHMTMLYVLDMDTL